MKCYEKAFVLGNEFSDEKFKDQFEMTKFWCPEQFFKDYDIEIEPSKCTCKPTDTFEEYFLNRDENKKICKECWSREFKPLKGDM